MDRASVDCMAVVALASILVSFLLAFLIFQAIHAFYGSDGPDLPAPDEVSEGSGSDSGEGYVARAVSIDEFSIPYEWDGERDSLGDSTPLVACLSILCNANGVGIPRDLMDEKIAMKPTLVKATDQLNDLLPFGYVSIPIEGVDLMELPAPSLIIVSDDSSEQRFLVRLGSTDTETTVVDPVEGVSTMTNDEVSGEYESAGMRAIYISRLGNGVGNGSGDVGTGADATNRREL